MTRSTPDEPTQRPAVAGRVPGGEIAAMSSPIHLTPEQAGRYLHEIDGHRQRYERVYQRVVELGYSERHPFRRNVRAVLIALRALCYDVNDMTQKGSCRAYLRRASNWPTI